MINITFKSASPDPFQEILKDIDTDIKTVHNQVIELGNETEHKMKEIIVSSKVRPQADEPTELENSIHTEQFPDGWGIGDIEKMKKDAPGWAAINFGSDHLVGKRLKRGVFDPGEPRPTESLFRTGRWKAGESYGKEQYSPIIKKPIIAINYIERTVFWLESKLNEIFKQGTGA